MKQVGLCVDDFGFKASVNEAVAQLVDAGIVTAVGCMSTGPAWWKGAALLSGARRDRADVGLHLNLTETWPGVQADYARPLPLLILQALLRLLPARALRETVERQLQDFEDAFGDTPDFIDGHQHVHQLPQVRDVLLECLERRPSARLPWLRCTLPAPNAPVDGKQKVIAALGGQGLVQLARRHGLAMNRHLLGVYGFDADAGTYEQLLSGWLAHCGDGDLLMLHPALRDPPSEGAAGDAISAAREVEYEVLTQRAADLLRRHSVQPVRPSRCPELLRH